MQDEIPPEAPRELKRRRTETDESQEEQWTRHPKLYVEDGTIVLLAGTTLFRPYGGLLSMHSEVFKDMLSLAGHQPADAETYDGCPLVRLSDSPQDLESFLEAYMDINYFSETKRAIPFPTVRGILRISTKYIVPKLRVGAIAYFYRHVPTTFEDSRTKPTGLKYVETYGKEREGWPQMFELATLFREFDIPRFLPWVYYQACTACPHALLDGQTKSGKTVHLSPQDARIVFRGWRALIAVDTDITVQVYSSAAQRCEDPECYDADERIALLKSALRRRRGKLPFSRPDTFEEGCVSCVAHRRVVEKAEVEKVWARLPGFFGLPPWGDLLRTEIS